MENAKKLSKEMLQNISSYDNKIKTIELFVDSVRKNPGEYLSSTGNEGWMNCIREVVQNGTDEIQRTVSPCDTVWVEYFEGTHRCIVKDNGRGIPVHDMIRVYSREHTSTNYDKEEGNYPSGLHGVGAKCVNAVSTRFSVTSYTYNTKEGFIKGHIDFSEGKPLKKYKGEAKIEKNKEQLHGTIVDFEPDFSIMGDITIRCEDVLMFMENLVPLLNIGAKMEFIGHKIDGKTVLHKSIINQDGTLTYLIRMTQKPLIKPIHVFEDTGIMKVDTYFTFVADVNSSSNVLTFANMTPVNTNLSTPSRGFIKGVQDFFRNYMNKVYLAANKRSKLEATSGDVSTGLVAACTAAHMNVMFDGQAKNVCKNADLEPFVRDATYKTLQHWSKTNPEDLQKLCSFFKDVATARSRADRERDNISKKYKNDDFTKLPKGFIKAENKDGLELFIVEGLSASSPCEYGRDSKSQAIFAIRGKMPNAFSTTKEKFLNNEEVKGIIGILGAGYGKNFDISKCPYDKIIILADADPDGLHIRTLVLKFLLLYCRPLIEEGRVYCGLSPLYHINKDTKNWRYFIDKQDVIDYVRKEFVKSYEIKHFRTKEKFTPSQISHLIDLNENYDILMNHIANTYAIHPILLEDIVISRDFGFKQFKTSIEKKYPYLKVQQRKGITILEGLADDGQSGEQTVLLTPSFVQAISPLFPYIDNSEKRYLMNGKKVGLYEVISTFRANEPKNMERAKGLGALNSREIGISTLSKDNRKLLRYTANDINKEISDMRKINDDKYSLIKGVDISQYEF